MPKLLIVDDEVDILDVIQSYFKKRGVEVFVAENGNDAVGIIDKEKPDLVLLDFNLPDISGAEVLKKIREELKSDIKVILVTGMEEDVARQETSNLGVHCIIHKPLTLDVLEKIVLAELGI